MKKDQQPIIPQSFEKEAWKTNGLVCGIDEVGRGCLAGPLVLCAAILFKDAKHKYLKDSKLLTHTQRLCAYLWLQNNAYYAVSLVNHRKIDEKNIYQATLHGMKKALYMLTLQHPFIKNNLRYVLVDAMPLVLPSLFSQPTSLHSFPFGEHYSKSIAAASIIAKITRDKLMETIDPIFPAFNLKKHKGYGTAEHNEHLSLNGPSIIHRTSFLKNHYHKHAELSSQLSLLE